MVCPIMGYVNVKFKGQIFYKTQLDVKVKVSFPYPNPFYPQNSA